MEMGNMCTAIFDNKYGHFFGRTLDLEHSYGEEVIRTDKGEELSFIYEGEIDSRFAFVGMAHRAKRSAECGAQSAERRTAGEVALYYDGMNESGLCIAALNFPKYAVYREKRERCRNLASFEVIPYILSSCGNIDCVEKLLSRVNVTSDAFSRALLPTALHWLIADRERSVVVEQTRRGFELIENPVGVMTNSPSFDFHMARLADYASLSPYQRENTLSPNASLLQYSQGLGAFGLPGDFSSVSRFVRAVYIKSHTLIPSDAWFEKESDGAELDRFFTVLGSVSVPLGCIMTESDKPVCTVYTSACDMDKLTYHYFTYGDRNIKSVQL